MVKSETLAMQLYSVMVKPVYCVRPNITVDSWIRTYCFNNRLTSPVYFNKKRVFFILFDIHGNGDNVVLILANHQTI